MNKNLVCLYDVVFFKLEDYVIVWLFYYYY